MKTKILFILIAVLVTGLSFAGSLTVNSPDGGESWSRGSYHNITWTASGLTNDVKITLWKDGLLVGLIVKDQASGSYNWRVGNHQGGVAAAGNGYQVKIREQGGTDFTTEDISNRNFNISDVRITSPDSRSEWTLNLPKEITWSAIGFQNAIKLTLWKDGALIGLIAKDLPPASGAYSWKVGEYQGGVAGVGDGYKIKAREQGGSDFLTEDESSSFKIKSGLTLRPGVLHVARDLEITELFTRNGMLFAKVRSNFGNFKKRVEFMVVPPVLRIEKNLDLRGNNIKNIAICRLDHFSLRGGFVSCMIDSDLKISETNERNNTKNIVSDWKDLTISCVLKEIKNRYFAKSLDYTVVYNLILKNKSNISLKNIKISSIVSTVGKGKSYPRVTIYENLAPFEEKTVHWNQVFSRREYRRDKTYYPLFKKGSSYRFVFRIDSNNRIDEINERNNNCVSTFKLTK